MGNPNFIHREACPICGSRALEKILSLSLTDAAMWAYLDRTLEGHLSKRDVEEVDFIVTRCPRCEFYFSADVPSEMLDAKLMTVGADHSASRQEAQSRRFYADYGLEAEKVATLLNRKPYGVQVLEFGSGNGHWLLMAKAYGYETTGVEIRTDRVAYARKNGLFIVQSLEELEGKQFDFIRIDLVLEHLTDPLLHLKALNKYLKPKGILRVGVPEGDLIYKILPQLNRTPHKLIGPIGHINCFTHKALVRLAEEAGLELIPAVELRRAYWRAMWENRDTKYIGEILKAGRKQRSNMIYLRHRETPHHERTSNIK